MIWGIGTGHCGTRSLAKWLGVPHEPIRRELEAHMQWYRQQMPMELHEQVLKSLRSYYLGRDEKGMVDSHLSPLIFQILDVDPDAKFVWVWREFNKVRKSHLRLGDSLRWYKMGNLPTPEDQEQYVWNYWTQCNLGIYTDLCYLPREQWVIVEAEDIPHRLGVSAPLEPGEFSDVNRGVHLDSFFKELRHEQREENGLPVLW